MTVLFDDVGYKTLSVPVVSEQGLLRSTAGRGLTGVVPSSRPRDHDDGRGLAVTEQPVFTQFGFSDEEWGLLVGLPQSVLTAASAAESDCTRRTMAGERRRPGDLSAPAGSRPARSWPPSRRGGAGPATRRPARSCR